MTKFEHAVVIAKEELAKGEIELRKRIIDRLVKEANMTPAGASTYASTAAKAARNGGPVPTSPGGSVAKDKPIQVMGYVAKNPRGVDPDKLWSACAMNKDIAYHVSTFCSEAEADKYCQRWGCTKVKGVQEPGKPLGTIVPQDPYQPEDATESVVTD